MTGERAFLAAILCAAGACGDNLVDARVDAPPPPDAAVDAPLPSAWCAPTTTGWRSDNPRPVASALRASTRLADGSVVLAGDLGRIVVVQGTDTALLCDTGGATIRGVWGTSLDDLWVVGDGGFVAHKTAEAFEQLAAGTTHDLRAVWGTSSRDLWVAGLEVVLHYDGATFSVDPRLDGAGALFGFASEDVWALRGDRASHWDGVTWHSAILPRGGECYFCRGEALWGAAPDDVWAASMDHFGYHFDGTTWSNVDVPGGVTKLDGTPDGRVYAASPLGLHRIDVSPIVRVETIPPGPVDTLAIDGPAFVVSGIYGRLTRVQGGVARPLGEDLGREPLSALWGTGGDLWAAGGSTILRRVDGRWAPVATPPIQGLRALAGTAADDVWASGDRVLHWDGTSWRNAPQSLPTETLVATARDDVWGTSGWRVVHYDGTSWSIPLSELDTSFAAIWASGPSDVWAVGYEHVHDVYGIRWHFDGGRWEATRTELHDRWYGVWGSAPDRVFFVGKHYDPSWWSPRLLVERWDGQTIHRWLGPASDGPIVGVTGDATSVYALDRSGAIYRFGDTDVVEETIAPGFDPRGLAAFDIGAVFRDGSGALVVVGWDGLIATDVR